MTKGNQWADWECRLANRPGQADPGAPHWIVMNLSRHKEAPLERRTALYFRHPSREAAIAEAQRLAERHPGKRFAVYIAGPSFKVEVPPPPDPGNGIVDFTTTDSHPTMQEGA
jgi:hypothetical protein